MARERFRYDRSSKWLIEHQGGAILKVGGMRDVEAWRAVHSEVVQPRQLPDGLLEVRRAGSRDWQPVVVEIEAYPSNQTPADLLDDLMLVYLNRGVLPDVLVLVLAPKGNVTRGYRKHLRPTPSQQASIPGISTGSTKAGCLHRCGSRSMSCRCWPKMRTMRSRRRWNMTVLP